MKTWHYVISELCNMKCTYCNVDVNNKIRLDEDFFLKFYNDEIYAKNEPYIFSIFGGEVFLQMDIVQYILSILENDPNLIQITITTNGTIYNEEVKKILKHPKLRCTISYDGIGQKYNRGEHKLYIRNLVNAGAIKGHCMLVGKNFETNKEYLTVNHEFIEDEGLNVDMTIVRDNDTWTIHQVNNFLNDYQNYVNFFKNNLYKYRTFSEIPGLILTYLNPILEYHMKNNVQKDCGVGVSYFSITPQGLKVPCERFTRDNSTIKKLNDKSSILEKCNTCDIKNYCHKGCTYEQLLNDEPIHELCEMYKGINKILKNLIKETNRALLILFKKENM